MTIQKQEFYQGAAIHRLVCLGGLKSISFEDPFFIFNDQILVYFKYSTKTRGPWGFSFMPEEQKLIKMKSETKGDRLVLGLVCGSDGVALVKSNEIFTIGFLKESSVRIACHRKHGEHYKVSGPEGELLNKVAPSEWTRLLANLGADQETV
jgi:hypothetical protein